MRSSGRIKPAVGTGARGYPMVAVDVRNVTENPSDEDKSRTASVLKIAPQSLPTKNVWATGRETVLLAVRVVAG